MLLATTLTSKTPPVFIRRTAQIKQYQELCNQLGWTQEAGPESAVQELVPDPYDCILSKLERNSSKDRDDAQHLFKAQKLDPQRLQERYETELRPYLADVAKHDLTLKLWIEIFES